MKKQITEVFIVCDLSGSMEGALEQRQREMVTQIIETFGRDERQGDQEFPITLIKFSDDVEILGRSRSATDFSDSQILHLTTHSRGMGSRTAMRDAIGWALSSALAHAVQGRAALVQVFTDGMENASRLFSTGRLAGLIANCEKTGNITLAVAGPKTATQYLLEAGVPAGNFRAWDGSVAEMAAVQADTIAATQTYAKQRRGGQRMSTSYYVDPSKLNTSAVRGYAKLVTPEAVDTVTKRMAGRSIADFYGGKFKAGNHYYQLIKPEYVQEDKDLVIHIKDANEFRLGSRSVRQLLGLPETGKIRVNPGPLNDKYEVFIQSNSVNRKLVEGQKLLTVEA